MFWGKIAIEAEAEVVDNSSKLSITNAERLSVVLWGCVDRRWSEANSFSFIIIKFEFAFFHPEPNIPDVILR